LATNDAVDSFGRLNSTEICISATNRKFPGRVRRIKSTVYLARLLTVARGPTCKRIEADEIWSFVYAKERNVPEAKNGKFGVGVRLDVGRTGRRHEALRLLPHR